MPRGVPNKTPEQKAASAERRKMLSRAAKKRHYAKLSPEHKAKKYAYVRGWRKRNPARVRELARRWANKVRGYGYQYGLTPQTFAALYESQGNVCAICLRPPSKINIDHCHVTGKVRGILCNGCNGGMGLFSDSPDRLRAAAAYLEKHGAR